MVGQTRWLFWPSTIRAAYLLGGAGEEQLNRQAATKPVTKGLKLMVTVQRYHEGRNRATRRRFDEWVNSSRLAATRAWESRTWGQPYRRVRFLRSFQTLHQPCGHGVRNAGGWTVPVAVANRSVERGDSSGLAVAGRFGTNWHTLASAGGVFRQLSPGFPQRPVPQSRALAGAPGWLGCSGAGVAQLG